MDDEPSDREQLEELRGECYRGDHPLCQWVAEPLADHVRPDPAHAILDSGVIRRWRDKIGCAAMAATYGQGGRSRELTAQVIADALACRVSRLSDLIDRVVGLLGEGELQEAENTLADWLGTRPAPFQGTL